MRTALGGRKGKKDKQCIVMGEEIESAIKDLIIQDAWNCLSYLIKGVRLLGTFISIVECSEFFIMSRHFTI